MVLVDALSTLAVEALYAFLSALLGIAFALTFGRACHRTFTRHARSSNRGDHA
jgi:hypothetical protein